MWFCGLGFACLLAVAPGGGAGKRGAGAIAEVPASALPALQVIHGKLRVFAGEDWLELGVGGLLPRPQAELRLSLGPDSCARLSLAGASVQLRGPLELESFAGQAWALRPLGSGRLELETRSTHLLVELPGTAWVELGQGVAWMEGVPNGGWRVGCDAGEPLRLRPPPGVRWAAAATLGPGAVLRVVPTSVTPPSTAIQPKPRRAAPWRQFHWPWTTVNAAKELPGDELERLAVQASAEAMCALWRAGSCAR